LYSHWSNHGELGERGREREREWERVGERGREREREIESIYMVAKYTEAGNNN
jgi:hypothetical protein